MQAIVTGKAADVQTNEILKQPQKKGFLSFYTKGEEIFNAVSHIVGSAWSVVSLLLLRALP